MCWHLTLKVASWILCFVIEKLAHFQHWPCPGTGDGTTRTTAPEQPPEPAVVPHPQPGVRSSSSRIQHRTAAITLPQPKSELECLSRSRNQSQSRLCCSFKRRFRELRRRRSETPPVAVDRSPSRARALSSAGGCGCRAAGHASKRESTASHWRRRQAGWNLIGEERATFRRGGVSTPEKPSRNGEQSNKWRHMLVIFSANLGLFFSVVSPRSISCCHKSVLVNPL